MNKKLFLYVSANVKKGSQEINVTTVSIDDTSTEERLNSFYRILDCNLIDIIEYNDEIDLIVDDEGMMVSNNPVFQIPSKLYVEPLHIGGNFLVGKKVNTPNGIKTTGFSSEKKVMEFVTDFKFSLIGVTS